MMHLTAEQKHSILTHYRARGHGQTAADVAAAHGVKGGASLICKWARQWDGTPASLKRQLGSGKARILSRADISRHVRAPILAANRVHRAVHYTMLLPEVQRKTRRQVSLRTLQRYGKEECGAKQKHSKKRTADESECMHTREIERGALYVEQRAHFAPQCPLISVSRSQTCDANSAVSAPPMSSFSTRLHSD
jgi:hypothetical protein